MDRQRALVGAILTSLGLGCGSATSPSGRSGALRPTYVDSVMRVNCLGAGNAACDLTRAVMTGMSEGVVPSRISVQTVSGLARWWAIVVESYKPRAQTGYVDSTEYIVLYPDTTFTYGAIINVYADSGQGFGAGPVYANNTAVGGANVVGSTAIVQVTTACTPVSGIVSTPPFPLSKCRFAQFRISASLGLGAFSAITVDQQLINGVFAGPL